MRPSLSPLLLLAVPVSGFVPGARFGDSQQSLIRPLTDREPKAAPFTVYASSQKNSDATPATPLSKLRQLLPSSIKSALFTVLALSPLAAVMGPADAAQSGGRVGGSGFRSAPSQVRRYASPPSRSYAPPPVSRGYVERVPVPVPVVPYSPFGFGGFGFPFSPYPSYGVTVVSPGISPLDIIIFGAIAAGALSLIRNRIAGSRWELDDEDGPSSLGDGVTTLKLQVGLQVSDRSSLNTILGQLEQLAKTADVETREGLSQLVSQTCLSLLRSSGDWVAAHGELKTFGRGDSKAEAEYQRLAIRERSKFEKEEDMMERRSVGQQPYMVDRRPTLAVVTLCVAIRGQATKFGQVNSAARLREALQVLAADALTDDGQNLLATEVLWTPQDDSDVLTKKDLIQDYPELIDI